MKTARAEVPGKVMLAGEYAVLDGSSSLAVTVAKTLRITAQRSTAGTVITSDLWSEPVCLERCAPQFIASEPLLQAIAWAQENWLDREPVHVSVDSQMRVSDGLGSSAAVRLGSLLALQALATGTVLSPWPAAQQALALQRQAQRFASGYDIVTQTAGGLVLWQADDHSWPGNLTSLEMNAFDRWVHIFVGGQGAPTGAFGGQVRTWLSEQHLTTLLRDRSQTLVTSFCQHFAHQTPQTWETLRTSIRKHRELFEGSPGFPHGLLQMLRQLEGFDRTWTFKTTGAGGEDAILLIGSNEHIAPLEGPLSQLGWNRLTAAPTQMGVSCTLEEIER